MRVPEHDRWPDQLRKLESMNAQTLVPHGFDAFFLTLRHLEVFGTDGIRRQSPSGLTILSVSYPSELQTYCTAQRIV